MEFGQIAQKVDLHIFTFKIRLICLDIICGEEPPEIPHNAEYVESLEKDDGRVFVQHFIYPENDSPLNGYHLSAFNQSDIPRNYNATLT